jgi:hypothetical protein
LEKVKLRLNDIWEALGLREKTGVLFLFLFLAPAHFLGAEELPRDEGFLSLESSLASNGGTGLIKIPNAKVIPYHYQGAGLHQYEIKYNYGLFPRFEIGVLLHVGDYNRIEELLRKLKPTLKYQLISSSRYLCNLSLGIREEFYYLVWDKYVKDCFTRDFVEINIGVGIFSPWERKERISFTDFSRNAFFSLSKILHSSYMAIIEYHLSYFNLGMRMLLSPRWKIDLFVVDIGGKTPWRMEKIVFGINFWGKFPFI